ncbi:hypothetical protein LCGC14_0457940 [marine sediment metagenome]|uniref:PD-(D/E)XK endonuclease-like domain-containing protein n=1 Tax=marine sediment metagenome TaxID=412755 RepID=A0A0F9V2Q4_9ZZZZ
MKQYLDDRVTRFILQRKREEFVAADVERHAGPLHASDLSCCLRKTVRGRRGNRPPLDNETLLRFSAGFAIQEWWLGMEEDGVPIDGVLYSTDAKSRKGVFEFKTTRYGFEKLARDDNNKYIIGADGEREKVQFVPLPEWITRCRMYCAAFEMPKAHIVVFFITSAEMHTWTLEFEPEELEDTRRIVAHNREVVQTIINEEGVPLPHVRNRVDNRECTFCPFFKDCEDELIADGWKEPPK